MSWHQNFVQPRSKNLAQHSLSVETRITYFEFFFLNNLQIMETYRLSVLKLNKI